MISMNMLFELSDADEISGEFKDDDNKFIFHSPSELKPAEPLADKILQRLDNRISLSEKD